MIVRWFVAFLSVLLISFPAQAEVKSATDKIADAFLDLDTDNTDSVSFAEYKAMVDQRAAARFRAMDANRDGEVDEAEYREFWRKTKAQWYRLQR